MAGYGKLLVCERVKPRWTGKTCVVAATGPSLTPEATQLCRGLPTIAVSNAYKLMPWADVLYSCDPTWWREHQGCRLFPGEKWSSHGKERSTDDKTTVARLYQLRLVQGLFKDGFSYDPTAIHYGGNSGFQAVNLAILFGATRIVLIGFDMRIVDDKRHFFGDHPHPLRNAGPLGQWARRFKHAAKTLPSTIQIVNATPGSAITCFPMVDLEAEMSMQAAA